MSDTLGQHYLENALKNFRDLKRLADRALTQLGDDEFFFRTSDEANSVALIVKHVAGNLRARWRDFLTTDGEKPDRRRDSEFEVEGADTHASLNAAWERGWQILFDEVGALTPEDLMRRVNIRGEAHTVVEAVNRQLTHYGQHVGQIIFLAKQIKAKDWQTLSIARGQSGAFNEGMREKVGGA
jgi:hypothetical protein